MQTSDYLEQLVQDKSDLVDNLTTMGIEDLTGDETFTELVPEVLNIPAGLDYDEYFKNPAKKSSGNTQVICGDWAYNIKKIKIKDMSGMQGYSYYGYFKNFLGNEIDMSNCLKAGGTQTLSYMFDSTPNLQKIDMSNSYFSNVATRMENMFNNCKAITIDLTGCSFGRISISASNVFSGATNLTNLIWGTDFGKGFASITSTHDVNVKLNLSPCTLLTHDSLMSVINNLYDLNLTYNVAGGGTLYRQELVIGNDNIAKLTAEEIQIATDKGWDVS